jgi:tetrahydromethanopterin S-methyltransferase subunit G
MSEPARRFASDEFFFLLQRIDRLDEKLTARIDAVGEKLTTRIEAVGQKLSRDIDSLQSWAIGLLFTLLAGFAGVIIALLRT